MADTFGKTTNLNEVNDYQPFKPHVMHWIWSLSLGGDAKNLCALAIAQQTWAKVSILTRSAVPGVRVNDLINTEIAVIGGIANREELEMWINNHNPSIVIFHRNGKPDKVEAELINVLHKADIPCFEYNTFARVDPSTSGLWAGHAHLSCTSMMQYASRLGVSPLSLPDHAAIGYAVDLPNPIEQEERLASRKSFGISSESFVILRLVRPDLRKWDPLPVLAARRLNQAGVPVHLIVRSAPEVRQSWIRQNLGKNVTLLEPTQNAHEIRSTLAASDCLVNYSHIGETFGLAVAEAMVNGLPVIVNSTPNMDNAQVEMCQYGSTGIIANTISAVVTALKKVQNDRDYAQQLAFSGKSFIENTFATTFVEARLRNFIRKCLEIKQAKSAALIPVAEEPTAPYILNQAWLDNYARYAKRISQGQNLDLRDLADAQVLAYLRRMDSLQYALDLGPRAILNAIGQRLKTGSLARR